MHLFCLRLLFESEDKKESDKSIENMKLAFLANDPIRWAPTVYDISLLDTVPDIVHDVDEFIGEDGEINFDNQTIKYEYVPTAEEAESRLLEMLGDTSMTIGANTGAPAKPFWKAGE